MDYSLPGSSVLDMSISTAASMWPSQPPAPYLSLESLPVLLFPGPALHCKPKLARKGLLWIFSQLPDPVLCIMETCVGFSHPSELTSMLWGLCVLVLAPRARLLCCGSCMHLCRLTSLLSMSQGLCVLLLAPQAHPLCYRAPVGLSQFPKPVILLLPVFMSFLWAEKCSYLCFLPSKSCLAWLSEIPQVPFGPPCEGASQCIGTLPAS